MFKNRTVRDIFFFLLGMLVLIILEYGIYLYTPDEELTPAKNFRVIENPPVPEGKLYRL